jgi:hypothetical protein
MMVPVLEVGSAPVQASEPLPPVAVHELALVLCQLSAVDRPVTKVLGKALKETMAAAGGGASLTFTITELGVPAPPVPEQVNT